MATGATIMEPSVDQNPPAWQPFTPRGVAAFARASVGRMLLVQFAVALLVTGTTVWFLKADWFPTITAAVERLPQQGEIRAGRLVWFGSSPQLLAESRFMAIAVDLNHEAQARSPAHLQIELGRSDLRIYSVFGYVQFPYPRNYVVPINFLELKPWWGAWAPNILGVVAALVLLALLIVWAALATLYCLPAWLLGLYFNRELTLWGSWRLAGVAMLPGALIMTVAIGLYGLSELDPVRLLAAFLLHFVAGWAFLALGAFAAPEIAARLDLKVNPFGPPAVRADEKLEKSPDDSPRNPFRTSDD